MIKYTMLMDKHSYITTRMSPIRTQARVLEILCNRITPNDSAFLLLIHHIKTLICLVNPNKAKLKKLPNVSSPTVALYVWYV